MARTQSTPVEQDLLSLFPSTRLRAQARAAGLVRRARKVDIVAFLWTLIFGFGTGQERSLAGLRRLFLIRTGVRLVPSAFYDRFTPALARFLRGMVDHGLSQMADTRHKLRGRLAGFKELLAADATVIRLADRLRRVFPGCRTNHTKAAAKLYMVMSVGAAGARTIQLTPERGCDSRKLIVGEWVKGRLLLFDLGFYSGALFGRIVGRGGHFISRLKENANPLIVEAEGPARRFVGLRLQDVLAQIRRPTLDVTVEVKFKRRTYCGQQSSATARFRVVAVRNADTRLYHCYITSVPPEMLSAEEVAMVYRLRWEVELLFKEMKGSYRLEDMPSGKKHVAEALLYASLLSLIASRVLILALRARLELSQRDRLRHLRWARALQAHASDVLAAVLIAAGARVAPESSVFRSLAVEAIDPNANRGSLFSRIEARFAA